MGYYVRAFCTSPKVPELAAIQRWLRERGSTAVLDEPTHAVEVARSAAPSTPILALDTSEWEQVGVAYKPGRLPILAECSRDDGTSESLLRQEVDEFIELIGDATPDGDRKSTRLNSSHSQISYAVFCLKKKNKKYHSMHTTQANASTHS